MTGGSSAGGTAARRWWRKKHAEADGQLMLLVQASDEDGTWSAGLVRAVPGDQMLGAALDLPRPGPGKFVSARLTRCREEQDPYARSVRLDGADWLLASAADPAGPAPALPR